MLAGTWQTESEGESESETTDAGLAWHVFAQNCCILSGGCSPCEAARISEFLGWNWTKNLLWLRYYFCFSLFLFFSLANVIDKFVVVEFFSFAGRLALRSPFTLLLFEFWLGVCLLCFFFCCLYNFCGFWSFLARFVFGFVTCFVVGIFAGIFTAMLADI